MRRVEVNLCSQTKNFWETQTAPPCLAPRHFSIGFSMLLDSSILSTLRESYWKRYVNIISFLPCNVFYSSMESSSFSAILVAMDLPGETSRHVEVRDSLITQIALSPRHNEVCWEGGAFEVRGYILRAKEQYFVLALPRQFT